MKKFVCFVFLLTWGFCGLLTFTVPAAEARMTRQQYRKNLAYNRNALPAGWRYEAGYTLWRMQRNLPINQHTYRRYRREKTWRNNRQQNNRAEDIVLNSLDWTVEEIALFWQNYGELFRFHPAGIDD